MLIVSFNVDGFKTDVLNWLFAFIDQHHPEIVCLNETKKPLAELTSMFCPLSDKYTTIFNPHVPSHWHGVAMLIRKDISFVDYSKSFVFSCPVRSDNKSGDPKKGRLLAVELPQHNLLIVATYVPNSGTRGLKNLPYRLEQWDRTLFETLQREKERGKSVVWLGDINVAPESIDVSHPRSMARWAGFTVQERDSFRNFLRQGWCDIWRQRNPQVRIFTWRGYQNQPNYGMRLDNIILSSDLESKTIGCEIVTDCPCNTDHVPVTVTLSL